MSVKALPTFSTLKPELVQKGIDELLKEARAQIASLTQQEEPTFDSLVSPLERMDVKIDELFSPLSHLNAVKSSKSLRDAYEDCIEKLSDYSTEVGQNQLLYRAFLAIEQSKTYMSLTVGQKKIIQNALRDFKLSGVALEAADRETFKQLQKDISKLNSTFQNNVLDCTDAWKYWVTEVSELKGVSSQSVQSAKEKAKKWASEHGDAKGDYLLGLDFPTYHAIIAYADNRELRRTFYEANVTRASDLGPHDKQYDNTKVMEAILEKNHAVAKLLGFKDYVEYSLATKMAGSAEEVTDFLLNIAKKARPFAERDFKELTDFAKTQGVEELQAWDVAYYSEKLKEQKYAFSDEMLREFFPIDVVLNGLFEVVQRLYGLTVKELKGVDIWDESVRFYQILDESGTLRGEFYLDLYARSQKRGGAWMDECRVRHHLDQQIQTPIAYLVTNFRGPDSQGIALLTHDEVLTLFHEFGHGLHHMLTLVDYPSIAGINGVPWDAVELPSQFMENFCWQEEALQLISGHYKTHQSIDSQWFDKMFKAKNFQSGMRLLRQVEFALFDIKVHQALGVKDAVDPQDIIDTVRKEVAIYIPPHFNRFAHSFTHIFAGGYSAGYYSYLWADLLASDTFARFEEEGIFNRTVGHAFMNHILEQGGTHEPIDLFVRFRGRKPSIDALLRHNGLVESL